MFAFQYTICRHNALYLNQGVYVTMFLYINDYRRRRVDPLPSLEPWQPTFQAIPSITRAKPAIKKTMRLAIVHPDYPDILRHN